MSRDYSLYLEDIVECIEKVEEYTKNMTYHDFNNNQLVIDAVLRNLEIIGEAVKNIPDEIRKQYPNIEWKKIAGLRDVLIHTYSKVELEIIWDIIQNNLLKLKKSVNKIKQD